MNKFILWNNLGQSSSDDRRMCRVQGCVRREGGRERDVVREESGMQGAAQLGAQLGSCPRALGGGGMWLM